VTDFDDGPEPPGPDHETVAVTLNAPVAAPPDTEPVLVPVDEAPRSLRDAVTPWIELVAVVAAALIAAVLLQGYVVKPYKIPSESMESTLLPGDRVLVARFWYRFNDIHRGDIVVFHPPGYGSEEHDYSKTAATDLTYIKRVIGLPGDWIGGFGGKVWICGARPANIRRPGPGCTALTEPYVSSTQSGFRFREVRSEHYFMMGDNRDNSDDSRAIGQIPISSILGRAFTRYWPPQRFGWFS
jgi:signal peptidase I